MTELIETKALVTWRGYCFPRRNTDQGFVTFKFRAKSVRNAVTFARLEVRDAREVSPVLISILDFSVRASSPRYQIKNTVSNTRFVLWVFKPHKAQRLLYVPPGLTFTNSTFCPHLVFMCFVWISEQTAIISLYSIN
jgi:hypothetical protein